MTSNETLSKRVVKLSSWQQFQKRFVQSEGLYHIILSECLILYAHTAGKEAAKVSSGEFQKQASKAYHKADTKLEPKFETRRMKSTKVQTLGANKICVGDWSCAGEKLATLDQFRDPTHQLSRCACVFITFTTCSQPLEQHCPESCVAVHASSSAASLFQNRCIRYQGM